MYNFKVSEETFGQLSQADVKIQIDDSQICGQIMMGKLLLSPNFQLKAAIDMIKTTEVVDKLPPASKLKQPKNKKLANKDEIAPEKRQVNTNIGQITIELNL